MTGDLLHILARPKEAATIVERAVPLPVGRVISSGAAAAPAAPAAPSSPAAPAPAAPSSPAAPAAQLLRKELPGCSSSCLATTNSKF